eukprot:363838-Chlamydomonas_euryale.AAC.4
MRRTVTSPSKTWYIIENPSNPSNLQPAVASSRLVATCKPKTCQAALGFKAGVISSGNSLDYTDKDMAIMLEHGVAVKEMEAAAIAWVCDLYHKPLLCVKAVTDIVDGGR